MRALVKHTVVIMLAFTVSACTSYRYEYIPPQDYEGVLCTRSCLDKKWDCSNNCESNHSRCLASVNNNINFNNVLLTVLSGNPNQPQDSGRSHCNSSKSSCSDGCNSFYNDCYTSCGGIVNVYEVK